MTKGLLAVLAALLLQGCGTVHNTMRDGGDERVALRGNDPVSYFSASKPAKGDPAIRSEWDGDTYRFSNAANKRAFDADPQKYAPAWSGFCASGTHYALKAAIGAEVFMVYKGRLYLFGSERSRANWLMDMLKGISSKYRPYSSFSSILISVKGRLLLSNPDQFVLSAMDLSSSPLYPIEYSAPIIDPILVPVI